MQKSEKELLLNLATTDTLFLVIANNVIVLGSNLFIYILNWVYRGLKISGLTGLNG